MALTLSTTEQHSAGQRWLREGLGNQVPDLQNADVAASLTEATSVVFHGQRFKVPPVPYKLGLRVQRVLLDLAWLHDELHHLSADDHTLARASLTEATRRLNALLDQAVDLCWWAVTAPPTWRLPQWLWRWRRNPFRHASQGELEELLAFFLTCRTLSRVRQPPSADRGLRAPLTPLTSSLPS